jgi:hypothetical protein
VKRFLCVCAIVFGGFSAPASAQGFAVDDLRNFTVDTALLEGGTFAARATAPDRLTIFCIDCPELEAIDVLLGRQDDGTEGRVRSGQTTMDQLEANCRAREASCTLEGISVGPAIGWVTTYEVPLAGSTTVLFRDGDLLTIRSIADDVANARRNGGAVRDALAPTIVGSE